MYKMSEFIKIECPSLSRRAGEAYNESVGMERGEPKLEIFAIMTLDDAVDHGILEKESYLECRDLLEMIWKGESCKPKDSVQSGLIEQSRYLRELYDDGFEMAADVYERWIENLSLSYENASRRWKILEKEELESLNSRIGENLVATVLYLGLPELGEANIDLIAKSLGFPVKLADNLGDLWNDLINEGYINLPKEEIENLQGLEIEGDQVKKVKRMELAVKQDYLLEQFQRVEKGLKAADDLLANITHGMNVNMERLSLARDMAYGFLLDAKKVYDL
jgi:hypothetical protein